jgi:hypothetical protein
MSCSNERINTIDTRCRDPYTGRALKPLTFEEVQSLYFAQINDIVPKIPKHIPKNVALF